MRTRRREVGKRGGRRFELCGNNKRAYKDHHSQEYLLAGPAGTGKTLANLCKLLQFGGDHPGSRMLIVRKTRVSLTETALVTWERDVLGGGHPILSKPLSRSHRHEYKYPNGSVLVTGGMDNPDKILSSEWDLIYVPEATDLDLLDWETLGSRLRANAGPYDQLFGDCNPTTPGHWLYKRCQAGRCKLYSTTHYDNPRYFDYRRREWTEAGRRYIMGRLQQMTGHRRDRFLRGLWVAAEGLIYDNFSPEIHLLAPEWSPPATWPRLWSLDWGYNPSPIVLQFWALDAENRPHLYRETYRTRQTVADLAAWAKGELESGDEPRPLATVSDHETEKAEVFSRVAGVYVTPAEKFDKLAGIQIVQEMFDVAPRTDGPESTSSRTRGGTRRTPSWSRQANRSVPWRSSRSTSGTRGIPTARRTCRSISTTTEWTRCSTPAAGSRPTSAGQQKYDGPKGEDFLPRWMGESGSATGW